MEQVRGAWVLPLDAPGTTADQVGGKAASLARLAAAGLPVPSGFLVTTDAYRRFLEENRLEPLVRAALATDDPRERTRAAQTLREAFLRGRIPADLAARIRRAYAELGRPAVAVRSSAVAEDQPDRSFAGQQETRLDVRGDDAVLDAVRSGFASLWTERAVAYRAHAGVPRDQVAMGLVIQEMVPAEVSGVLFTANPTTGDRGELVLEAAPGLGEALVAGAVTPDTFLVDRTRLETKRFVPGAGGAPGRGGPGTPALGEELVREISALGLRVERELQAPQDIEWAVANGELRLLQARPITALPPAVEEVRWDPPVPGSAWIRRQVVEHMPDPLSPLFEDLYLEQGLEDSLSALVDAIGLTRLVDATMPRPFFATIHGYAYMRADNRVTARTALGMLGAVATVPAWLFREGLDYWRDRGLAPYQEVLRRWRQVDPAAAAEVDLLRGVRELALADARYWFAAAMAIGAAKVSEWVLDVAFARHTRGGVLLRGFSSPTLAAEAELDGIARLVRSSPDLRRLVAATPAERLLDVLPDNPDGRAVRAALDRYLAHHGHQVFNLDFAAPTLAEAPLAALVGLKLRVTGQGRDPRARRAEVVWERERRTEEVAASIDPVRRMFFVRLLDWAQQNAPYREEALSFVGAGWPTLRRLALELGRRLVERGALTAPGDVFFFRHDELARALEGGGPDAGQDLVVRARERRALQAARRRLHPPPAVPLETRFRFGPFDLSEREAQRRNEAGASTLRGFPVSAGRVTAPATVVHSPEELDRMEPGTILVCPTTTPAWTPLFAQARGLVTDVGGVLAHGSIVAREYGIPAVMGTGDATRRVMTGQVISVDGTAGTVTLLPPGLQT